MTMVPWSVLAPQQVETIVGVLLGRDRPRSIRLRPSRGDRGIDVLDPLDSPRQVDVYQVKSFATRLDSSRKRKIAESLARAATNPEVIIRDWYLVLPLNPTPDDWTWFRHLAETVDFRCFWFGLDRLEGLAATYQDVVDYYIGDGRRRLEESIEQLRAMAGLTPATDDQLAQLLSPPDVTGPLTALYRNLNRDDPHYRYEFHVGAEPHRFDPLTAPPDLVASFTHCQDDVAVTHHMYALYAMATEDRPIPVTFTVHIDRMDESVAQRWQQAERYGTPVTLPASTVTNFHVDLPGGLATTAEEGTTLQFGPAWPDDARPYKLRLRLVDPDERLVNEIVLDMDAVSRGITGTGWRGHGTALAGAFELEILGDVGDGSTIGPVRLYFSVGALTGAAPAALRSGIRFLASLHHPHRLQFAPEYGPPARDAVAVPADKPPISKQLFELVEALADLQAHVAADLRTPDLDSLTVGGLRRILMAARLVRGETIRETWSEYDFTPTSAPPTDSESVQLALSSSYGVAVGEQTVTLEPVTIVLLAAQLHVSETRVGAVTVRATPALGNNTMLIRLGTFDELAPHHLDESTSTPPNI